MESESVDHTKDVEEPEELSNDGSDDSMEDEEDDAKVMAEVAVLNKKIETAPYSYQAHVERIALLRKCGEYDQLLAARKNMADLFPLTQELWLNWLEDEQKFADSEEEHENVEKLFERAVQDYMCPEIWLEYAQYSIRYIGKDGGFEKIRDVLKRAITAVGLHARKGASLWEAYREIENAILVSVQPAPGSVSSPEQIELINDQTSRITSLFTRQLAIPLLDMEETMEEYMEWRRSLDEEEDIAHHVKDSYTKALKMLEELRELEADLEGKDIPSLEIYKKYIDCEKKSNDPARVQSIYERAISEHCLNSELWGDYLSYLNKTLKSGPIVVSTCGRAVRNCPWTSSLWQSYMLALERNNSPHEKLESTYKDALQVGFSSAGDYAYLFQTWCDVVRRQYCNGTDKDELGRLLRAAFENATSYLLNNVLTAFKSTGDPDYTVWCYWSRCEAKYLKNMVKARQILDVVMEDDPDARRNWKIWKEYYELESIYGDVEHRREVLRRAAQSSAADDGGAEMACTLFIRFERENGSLEDLDDAMKKVEGRLAKVHKRKEKVAHQMQEKKQRWEQNGSPKWKKNERKPREERSANKRPAQREGSRSTEIPKKRLKPEVSSSDQGFKAPSSLPLRFSRASPKHQHDSKMSVTIAPPPGFQENKQAFEKTHEHQEATPSKPPGYEETTPERDERTVFLSNLGYDVESIEEKLKQIFSACGAIAAVRLVRSHKGGFRGYAYLEFESKSSIEAALKLDRQPLEGRPIFVSPTMDKTKHPEFKVFKYSKGMEKHKLFISGLCFDTTEETLKEFFSAHGAITSTRIVTARSGKSKGLAYIEYEKEADAAQAIFKADQAIIDGFTIKVAISNPPSRIRPEEEREKSLGGGGRSQVVGGRGRGRTQVSFLPRTLLKSSATVGQAATKQEEAGTGKPMSNKDFAKLLMKK